MNATWWRRIEANGKWTEEEGILEDFKDLVGNGLSQVEMNTTLGFDYASVKVTASIRVTCNQDNATIEKAAERAFFKSLEYAKDGMSQAAPVRDKLLKDLYGGGT